MLVTNPEVYPKFAERLDREGIPHLDAEEAAHRDFYPVNVGLANLMPATAMKATEMQWFRWMGSQVSHQVIPHFIKFADDVREQPDAKRSRILDNYTALPDLAKDASIQAHGVHVLVVTGDNQETKAARKKGLASRDPRPAHEERAFDEISYDQQLRELIDFSEHVPLTIFSCLGAHFALNRIHGLSRKIMDKKQIGVFDHKITDTEHPLMRGMGGHFISPHSRWGNITAEEIAKVPSLRILAASKKAGWLAVEEQLDNGNRRLYLQGHPEYDLHDLGTEYERDREQGIVKKPPVGYYPKNNPKKAPEHRWEPHAKILHMNVLGLAYSIAEQQRIAGRSPAEDQLEWFKAHAFDLES